MESVESLVDRLGLVPHPEGGFYRETYRASVTSGTRHGERSFSTAIYYLLRKGDVSRFHRIRSDEVWHFYAGAPLRVLCLDERGRTDLLVGLDLAAGYAPQAVVPAGTWFGAKSEGDFSFVGCTVSPGFAFEDFELAKREELEKAYPEHRALVHELT